MPDSVRIPTVVVIDRPDGSTLTLSEKSCRLVRVRSDGNVTVDPGTESLGRKKLKAALIDYVLNGIKPSEDGQIHVSKDLASIINTIES
jgi:hypothetical protein